MSVSILLASHCMCCLELHVCCLAFQWVNTMIPAVRRASCARSRALLSHRSCPRVSQAVCARAFSVAVHRAASQYYRVLPRSLQSAWEMCARSTQTRDLWRERGALTRELASFGLSTSVQRAAYASVRLGLRASTLHSECEEHTAQCAIMWNARRRALNHTRMVCAGVMSFDRVEERLQHISLEVM